MGSITDITDCHGTVLNHYAYDAFGNRTVEEETVENRFGFAGEMLDAVTGQYYLRARFYNPVIARFLSEDTYYGDGLNQYAYCHNNPVGYVDPSGHEGLICSKKYGELKQKEAEGGTLSEKEKRQIYEYEQNQKKSNGAGSDSKSCSNSKNPMTGDDWHKYFNEKYGAENVTWESASIQDIIDMPSKITDFSPKQISDLARRSGWTVGPLGKGSLAGITYEQGGGISMHAPNGSSIYIQYHPGGGHHGVMLYYKVSSGKNGTVRYYINGERAQ